MITMTSEASGYKISMELACSRAFSFQGKAILNVANAFALSKHQHVPMHTSADFILTKSHFLHCGPHQ